MIAPGRTSLHTINQNDHFRGAQSSDAHERGPVPEMNGYTLTDRMRTRVGRSWMCGVVGRFHRVGDDLERRASWTPRISGCFHCVEIRFQNVLAF